MSDDATPKDTLVSEPAATPAPKSEPEPTATPEVKLDNAEAAELGNILINSGYTKDKVNELLEAPGALAALRYAVENDPKEFLSMLQRANPQAADKFLQSMADTFVDRYDAPKPKTNGKDEPNSELMAEVAALRDKTNRLETTQAQRDAAAQQAATQQRYNARVDDLFGQIKEMNLTKSEQAAMRARLDKELSADRAIVQRASQGNFVDVPMKFKQIVDEWTSDKKAQADAEKTARERQQKGAFPEFQSGPSPAQISVPDATFDSWDSTEAAFAKALDQYAQ